jgi:hypothetical protein
LFSDGPSKTIGGRGTWNDPDEVRNHFAKFGVEEVVTHYKLRSDEFFSSYSNRNLPDINLAFIDGSHKFQDVQFDFINVLSKCSKNSYIFVHDTNIYIRELLRNSGVKRYLNLLRREEKAFEIIDFPFSSGVALIRVMEPKIWQQLQDVSSRH